MFTVQALPGLPPYGEPALSFPQPGAFREGFVVRFATGCENVWTGNFAKYWDGLENSIHTDLGPQATFIVAGGAGYIVDADRRKLVHELAGEVRYVLFEKGLHAFIISNGLWFEAFDAQRMIWRSARLSWDGIRRVEHCGLVVTGEAYEPQDRWVPFKLDIENGQVIGGSYSGPPM